MDKQIQFFFFLLLLKIASHTEQPSFFGKVNYKDQITVCVKKERKKEKLLAI